MRPIWKGESRGPSLMCDLNSDNAPERRQNRRRPAMPSSRPSAMEETLVTLVDKHERWGPSPWQMRDVLNHKGQERNITQYCQPCYLGSPASVRVLHGMIPG